MSYLVALLALWLAAPANVTVTKLDGTSQRGELQSWVDGEVVLVTAAGPQKIAANDLLEVRLSTPASENTGGLQIELVDGSQLPLKEYSASTDGAKLELTVPSSSQALTTTAPLDSIRSARLQPLVPEAVPQWDEIRRMNLPSDVVVVAKRGGKSLDHLECVVGEITKDEVELTVDGQSMRVPRSKVAGVIYYRSDDAGPAAAIVSGPDGLRVAAKKIQAAGEGLILTTESGLQLVWPLAGISAIDLSAGKVAFLGDLKPASADWQPLVALPAAATRALKFGEPRFNQAAGGGELALAYRDANLSIGSPDIKTFAKGLAVRSRSEIIYRLPAGYSRFLAEAGIDPNNAASGNVHLTIYGDDEPLFEQSIDGSDAPASLDLDVTSVKRLRIFVDYGDNLDTGDWLNLCNARIVK